MVHCTCTHIYNILPNLTTGDKLCAGDLTTALAVNVHIILYIIHLFIGDCSNYRARGYKHVHVHDKRTSTASVHFLVYFVAVPGEKMIIIHSINHVIYHHFHVIMMNFYELTDCVLERLSLYGSKGRREREGGGGERERDKEREKERSLLCPHDETDPTNTNFLGGWSLEAFLSCSPMLTEALGPRIKWAFGSVIARLLLGTVAALVDGSASGSWLYKGKKSFIVNAIYKYMYSS